MRYLKNFNESRIPTDYVEVMSICKDLGLFERGYTTTINDDGTVDTNRHVILGQWDRIPVRFRNVHNDFKILKAKMTSLEGCPRVVSGTFELDGLLNLKSLQGGPEFVSKYYLFGLEITSLDGLPEEVDNLAISGLRNLTSLKGLPKMINQRLSIGFCPLLWDPQGLRDVHVGLQDGYIGSCPIEHLVKIFGSLKSFQDSLDYNYIRKPIHVPRGKPYTETWDETLEDGTIVNYSDTFVNYDNVPAINLFRFREALDELGVTTNVSSTTPPYREYINAASTYPQPKDRVKDYLFVDDNNKPVDFDGNPVDYLKLPSK